MSGGIVLDKTDKHGNIDAVALHSIKENLLNNKFVILPVDGIYVTAALLSDKSYRKFLSNGALDLYLMVKNFTELERYSRIDKKDYDFLHRLWPDDVYVKLHTQLEGAFQSDFFFYIPKTEYLLTLLKEVDQPIIFSFQNNLKNKPVFTVDEIREKYARIADQMLIINQYCKEHLSPTFIDIRDQQIQIVNKGRVDDEDIKSLYYL